MAIMAALHVARGLEQGTPQGPPPLRSRALPFGLADLSERSRASCRAGTELFLRHFGLADGVAAAGGDATTEHPADPGCIPYPSIFNTGIFREHLRSHARVLITTDQCMRGADQRKRIMLGG